MNALIISDREPLGSQVRQALIRNGLECPPDAVISSAQLPSALGRGPMDLLVLILPSDPEQGLALLAELRARIREPLLAVGPATEVKMVMGAMRAGADYYCDETDLEAELAAWVKRRQSDSGLPGRTGRVLAVLGPAGGSGASTVAVNLATALAQRHRSVLLADLKLQTGDLATLLDLKPVYTLADLCRYAEQLDRVMFERALMAHSSGVLLLAAPQGFADAEYVTPAGIGRVLTLGRALVEDVVVDVDHSFRPEQVEVLRQAEAILLVLRLDFTGLRNSKRTLDYLASLGVPSDRVRLVVNRHGQSKEVPASKAEQALGAKIAHYVPDDPRTINHANNQGVPAILHHRSAKVCRSLIQLAASLNGS